MGEKSLVHLHPSPDGWRVNLDPSPGTCRACPWLQGLWQERRIVMEQMHKEHAFHCPKQCWETHKSKITDNLWESQSLPKFSYYKALRICTFERPVNRLLPVVSSSGRPGAVCAGALHYSYLKPEDAVAPSLLL